MSAVAIIPARGGSKRIPRKNIRPFFGKPILWYSVDTAKRSGLFDAIYVSTEDPEIATIALNYGAQPIVRPANLAEMNGAPDCGTQEVTRHAIATLQLDGVKMDYACCIYPCAPMLSALDLKSGFDLVENPLVATPPFTYISGAYYWGHARAFLDRVPLADGIEMANWDGRHIDINTLEDWARAERMYAGLHGIPHEPA